MDNGDAESSLTFDFEEALNVASGFVVAAPSSGAASSDPAVDAPSHGRSFRRIVCRHWVRGLCMKGDECSFLHQYDMDRMPVCHFFSENGYCGEEDCVFKHINPDVRTSDAKEEENAKGVNCADKAADNKDTVISMLFNDSEDEESGERAEERYDVLGIPI